MQIFITGGSGFIGSNFLLDILNSPHINILNFDRLTYASNNLSKKQLEKFSNYSFVQGDINESEIVSTIISDFKPDIIVNFAAETHVDNSISEPSEFINTNINGTYTLLKCAFSFFKTLNIYEKEKFKFIQISTDEVYGSLSFNDTPFTEENRFLPNSPYSASKASADLLCRSWNKTYNFPTIVTHCSNNFGPFQHSEKLIPKIIKNALSGFDIPIYGDGTNIRDWIFVTNHVNAINRVIKFGQPGQNYNIGGEMEISNIELVKKICNILDEKYPRKNKKSYEQFIKFVPDRPGHDLRYAVNCAKIKADLGWRQIKNFEENLTQTVDWYYDFFKQKTS
jgi:dTDP-glucose 4,6-dehydratase